MRYSGHAEDRIAEYQLTKAEVAAIVQNPVRGIYSPMMRDCREHFGYAADGRPMNVITNAAATIVITVVPQ
ncbi:MAG: hypothetical protein QOJ39_3502 [Candidatus Eremiobacteraeota bacterium]|jgi:hypothetical protein|nr:hypothetical protein [Candidatus Eremiobacteraeota bacterium]